MGLAKYLGLDKLATMRRMWKQHGGLKGNFKQMYLTDQAKEGSLVGMDEFGNRYYENNKMHFPRNRWVDFNRDKWLDYDASQVPPQWHRWLVQSTDIPPTKGEYHDQHRFLLEHKENLSGMTLNRDNENYMPYSTTRPKTTMWTPPTKHDKQIES